jgi:hypothetical protein
MMGGQRSPDEAFGYNHIKIINNIAIDIVHREGGSEGEGEHVERVLRVVTNPVVNEISRWQSEIVNGDTVCHIIVQGSYNSYEGTDWYIDSAKLVFPRQVLVTQYFSTP